MLRLNELVRRFTRDQRGTTAIEYGLIALLVAVGFLAGLKAWVKATPPAGAPPPTGSPVP
jgi:Flp pilus assembly pilin Flp